MAPPGEFDVICGRGRSTFMHLGNKRFRQIIADHINIYSIATTRLDKSMVVSVICDSVREKGDFVRQLPVVSASSEWGKVSERMAREKCGQGLRDFLHSKYRSSTQAKRARRKHDLEEQRLQMEKVIETNVQIRSVLGQLKSDLSSTRDFSDATVQQMFTSANSLILEELKVVSLTLPSSVAPSHSSPASPSPPRSALLLRKVVTDEEQQAKEVPYL